MRIIDAVFQHLMLCLGGRPETEVEAALADGAAYPLARRIANGLRLNQGEPWKLLIRRHPEQTPVTEEIAAPILNLFINMTISLPPIEHETNLWRAWERGARRLYPDYFTRHDVLANVQRHMTLAELVLYCLLSDTGANPPGVERHYRLNSPVCQAAEAFATALETNLPTVVLLRLQTVPPDAAPPPTLLAWVRRRLLAWTVDGLIPLETRIILQNWQEGQIQGSGVIGPGSFIDFDVLTGCSSSTVSNSREVPRGQAANLVMVDSITNAGPTSRVSAGCFLAYAELADVCNSLAGDFQPLPDSSHRDLLVLTVATLPGLVAENGGLAFDSPAELVRFVMRHLAQIAQLRPSLPVTVPVSALTLDAAAAPVPRLRRLHVPEPTIE